jgi:hypothetical protein
MLLQSSYGTDKHLKVFKSPDIHGEAEAANAVLRVEYALADKYQ